MKDMMNQLMAACDAAEIPFCGTDFLCRALAVVHCYGGGPGGEYFRAPGANAVAMKAGRMLEEAVLKRDWSVVEKIQEYVRDLQADDAPWLEKTLERLNIPAKDIKFSECLQPEGRLAPQKGMMK